MMTDYSEETRRIYHAQHTRIANDDRAMRRFIGMFSEPYFGVEPGYFSGKTALDAGCGDTAKTLIALYRLGCHALHGCDLGDDFIPVAKRSLANHGVPDSAVTLRPGSVLDLPYEDGSFDFVSCHGVLVHLNNLDEVREAFGELSRVTRRGGDLYTVYGNVGGFFEDCLIPAARQYYRTNEKFRELIDGISPEHFSHLVDLAEKGFKKHEGLDIDLSAIRDALDVDLCVTIQNLIQAPVQLVIPEDMIRQMYAAAGFETPRRLRRYVKRENIRRFFAPLHYEVEDPLVQMLYGSGNLEFIARKAA